MEKSYPNSPNCQIIFGPGTVRKKAALVAKRLVRVERLILLPVAGLIPVFVLVVDAITPVFPHFQALNPVRSSS